MPDVTLRALRPGDLPTLWRWVHAVPHAEWRRWDAPYFHETGPTDHVPYEVFEERTRKTLPNPDRLAVTVNDALVGTVSRSWEAPRAGAWADLGVVLYDPASWGRGTGTRALTLWTDRTFEETDAHVLTLTTWSGNERMLRAAARVGYRECARVREARLWQGRRYDSVKLDLLRSEWTTGAEV